MVYNGEYYKVIRGTSDLKQGDIHKSVGGTEFENKQGGIEELIALDVRGTVVNVNGDDVQWLQSPKSIITNKYKLDEIHSLYKDLENMLNAKTEYKAHIMELLYAVVRYSNCFVVEDKGKKGEYSLNRLYNDLKELLID